MTKSVEEAVEAPEYVIQMAMDHTSHPWVLTNKGRLFQRGDDKDKINQPFGPHWSWHEVAGPV